MSKVIITPSLDFSGAVAVTGDKIIATPIADAASMLNGAFAKRRAIWVAMNTEIAGWGATAKGKRTHGPLYYGESLVTVFEIPIWIDPDYAGHTIALGARALVEAGSAVLTRLVVASTNIDVAHVAGDTGKWLVTSASTPGTGWQLAQVQLQRTSGATTISRLQDLTIYAPELTNPASIPDPSDE